MELVRLNAYEIELRINVEDAKILADACGVALERVTARGQEDLRNQLSLWQAFFQASALGALLDYALPRDGIEERDRLLQELELAPLVHDDQALLELAERDEETLGEFVESPRQ